MTLPPSPFTKGWQFSRSLLDVARSYLGHEETAPNSSPLIDGWLAGVGQPPGKSWCAAAIHGWCEETAKQLGIANPCPRTASALRMWEMLQGFRVPTPTPGCLGFSDHGQGKGHVWTVEEASGSGFMVSLSGNTNAEGSREGNCVARHQWDWLLGLAHKVHVHGGRLLGFADLALIVDRAPDALG